MYTRDMDDLKSWSLKILIPALVAVSIKLAVMAKIKTVSWFNVITSFITGIGSAYLASDWVLDTFSVHFIPIAIAIITISGEKIGYWAVYKFNVESVLETIVDKMKGKK